MEIERKEENKMEIAYSSQTTFNINSFNIPSPGGFLQIYGSKREEREEGVTRPCVDPCEGPRALTESEKKKEKKNKKSRRRLEPLRTIWLWSEHERVFIGIQASN